MAFPLWQNLQNAVKPTYNSYLKNIDNLGADFSYVPPSNQTNTSIGGYDPKLENETQEKNYRGLKINSMWMNTEKVKLSRQDFFPRYAASLGIKLEAGDKIVELQSIVDSSYPDDKDRVMTRYQQTFQAGDGEVVPVLAGNYLLIEKDGVVYYAKGELLSGLEAVITSTTPQKSESEASAAAIKHLGEDASVDPDIKPQLVIVSPNNVLEEHHARLAWRILLESSAVGRSTLIDIDANTLEVIQSQPGLFDANFEVDNAVMDSEEPEETLRVTPTQPNGSLPKTDLQTIQALDNDTPQFQTPLLHTMKNTSTPESGPTNPTKGDSCSGIGIFGENQQFKCDKQSDVVTLNCPMGNSDANCRVEIKIFDQLVPNTQTNDPKATSTYFIDSDHNGVFNDENDKVGVSLAGNLQKILDILASKFKHIGIDGLGKIPIQIYIREPTVSFPTSYNGVTKVLSFAGKTQPQVSIDKYPAVCLDIIGHELGHGILHHFVPNTHREYEMGALDEGFASILGEIFENIDKNGKADWKISADLYANNSKGEFANPKLLYQPNTYLGEYYFNKDASTECNLSNDFCNVHSNAMVLLHWFYLSVFGGQGTGEIGLTGNQKIEGIGFDQASALVMATLKRLGPNDGYKEARRASLDAAKDLFGTNSPHVSKIALAWDGVGVKDTQLFVSPADKSIDVEAWPTRLQVEKQNPDEELEIELATDPGFTENRQIDFECTTVPMSGAPNGKQLCQVEFDLKPNEQYYWHFRPIKKSDTASEQKLGNTGTWKNINNKLGSTTALTPKGKANLAPAPAAMLELQESDWSPVFSFKTHSKMIETLVPIAGGTLNPWKAKFSWKIVTGKVANYKYAVDDDPTLGVFPYNEEKKVSEIPSQLNYISNKSIDANSNSNISGGVVSDETVLPMGKQLYWSSQAYGPNKQHGQLIFPPMPFKTDIPKITLQSPANDQVGISPITLQMAWSAVAGADHYKLQISQDPTFNSTLLADIFVEAKSLGDFVNYSPALTLPDGKIYWRVIAQGPKPYLETVSSEIRSFTMDNNKAKPVLIAPVNNAVIPYKTNPLLFQWTPVEGATSYKLIIRDAKSSEWKLAHVLNTNSYTSPSGAENLNGWCWKVIPLPNQGVEGPESEPFCYQVQQPPPGIGLISPAQGQTEVSYEAPSFHWSNPFNPDNSIWIVMHIRSIPAGSEPPPPLDFGTTLSSGDLPGLYFFTYKPNEIHNYGLYNSNLVENSVYAWNIYFFIPVNGNPNDFTSPMKLVERSPTGIFKTKAAPKKEEKPPSEQNSGCTKPNAPKGIADTEFPSGGSNDAYVGPVSSFKWWAVSGASAYQLEVGPANGTPISTEVSATNCNTDFCQTANTFNLTPGIWHYWRVRAVNKNSCGSTAGPWPDPNNGYNGWTPFAPY